MGLQQAGHCTDSSFVSGIWVVGRGQVTRSDSEGSGEARELHAWEGQVHGDCYAPCRSRPGPEFGSVRFGVWADAASASGSLR